MKTKGGKEGRKERRGNDKKCQNERAKREKGTEKG